MDVLGYFNEKDASNINWAHAVNNLEKLDLHLKDDNINMLEADVMFLKPSILNTDEDKNGDQKAMMGHPPHTESDLSFKQWLDHFIACPVKKGIKLDFKDQEAVMPSLELLKMRQKEIDFPVWLNADILPGPGAESAQIKINGSTFLTQISSIYPQCTLSLGWTTDWQEEIKSTGYSWKMMKQMQGLLKECGIKQPVTFPVCAHHLTHSSVVRLLWLTEVTGGNLTVWANEEDFPAPASYLLYARHVFSQKQVFYDIVPLSSKNDFDIHKHEAMSHILQIAEEEGQTKYLDILQRGSPQITQQWEKVVGSPGVFVGSQSVVMRDGVVSSVKQYTINNSRLIDLVGTMEFNCPQDKTEIFGVEIFFQVRDTVDLDSSSSVRCYLGAEGKIVISIMGSNFKMQREETVLPEPPSSIDFKITNSRHSISISVCPSSVDSVDDTIEKGRCLTVNLDDLEDLEGHVLLRVNEVDDAYLAFESLEIVQS